MATFALDTSCIVAVVCSWHEHHAAAAAAITSRLERRQQLVVGAPALVESYAVLTRLPSPHRLSPVDAWTLLEANFVKGGRITALSAASYVKTLDAAHESGVAGGRTYDAIIAACAVADEADELLTFNPVDFAKLTGDTRIVDPSEA